MRRSISSLALVAVSLSLAACGDAATAPDTAAAPSGVDVAAPNNAWVTEGPLDAAAYLTARIVDVNDKLMTEGGWIRFSRYPYIFNKSWVEIQDNTAGDLDPTLGIVKVKLIKGEKYEACHTKATYNYVAVGASGFYPTCRLVETSAVNVDLGKLYARKYPRITWKFVDEFGNLLKGATLDLTLNNNTKRSVTDGDGWMDGSFPNGEIAIKLGEQQVAWCVAKPPYKHEPITNKCGSFFAEWEETYAFTIVHEKLIY